MRKWATLLLLWGIAWPAMAAKTMSIEQMEQMLVKLQGKPDGKVAGELEDTQVTERVSLARLKRWEADFPGKRTQEELMKLADTSAFLNPPAADVLRDPPPDEDTQRQILEHAVEYIKTTMTRLPNFYATRETAHFEDIPSQETIGAFGFAPTGSGLRASLPPGIDAKRIEYKSLHSTGMFSSVVTYRDGIEVRDSETGKGRKEDQTAVGLTTSGEFGPILSVVIADAVHGQVKLVAMGAGRERAGGCVRLYRAGESIEFHGADTARGEDGAALSSLPRRNRNRSGDGRDSAHKRGG